MIIRTEVQLTPQITTNGLQHYWQVYQLDEQGNKFTLKSGFSKDFLDASSAAYAAGQLLVKNRSVLLPK